MKEKDKIIVNELMNIINKISFEYILKYAEKEGDPYSSDLINIVLSAHLSSAFSIARIIAYDNKLIFEQVNNFIKSIYSHLLTIDNIVEVEIMGMQ